jgi:outer membrane protein OmpA-like peptidoglycan-associated protein
MSLRSGGSFTFFVKATNAVGTSSPSKSSPVVKIPSVSAKATVAPFAVNSAELTSSLKSQVAALAREIEINGDSVVALVGYSDNSGSAAQELDVSKARAADLKTYLNQELVKIKVTGIRVSVAGKGSADPVSSNGTAAGRARNRRVVASLS